MISECSGRYLWEKSTVPNVDNHNTTTNLVHPSTTQQNHFSVRSLQHIVQYKHEHNERTISTDTKLNHIYFYDLPCTLYLLFLKSRIPLPHVLHQAPKICVSHAPLDTNSGVATLFPHQYAQTWTVYTSWPVSQPCTMLVEAIGRTWVSTHTIMVNIQVPT